MSRLEARLDRLEAVAGQRGEDPNPYEAMTDDELIGELAAMLKTTPERVRAMSDRELEAIARGEAP